MVQNRLILVFLVVLVAAGCDTGLDDALVSAPPPAPTLMAPLNLSSNERDAVSLTWEEVESSLSYQVQVSRSPGFTDVELEKLRVLETHLDVRELELGVTYHWRVRATNDLGVSDWSPIWTFVPESKARFPSRTDLFLPADRSVDQPTVIEFKWKETTEAVSYHLEIALDRQYISTFASLQGITSTNQFVYGLVKSYTYYWRVRAYNPAGYGAWSDTRYVIIGGIEGEEG